MKESMIFLFFLGILGLLLVHQQTKKTVVVREVVGPRLFRTWYPVNYHERNPNPPFYNPWGPHCPYCGPSCRCGRRRGPGYG